VNKQKKKDVIMKNMKIEKKRERKKNNNNCYKIKEPI
jgi:hypothetical protein